MKTQAQKIWLLATRLSALAAILLSSDAALGFIFQYETFRSSCIRAWLSILFTGLSLFTGRVARKRKEHRPNVAFKSWYCVTRDDGRIDAHGPFTTGGEATAFKNGVEFVNDSAITVSGPFNVATEAQAIAEAKESDK